LDHPNLIKSNKKDPSPEESGSSTETDNSKGTNIITSVVDALNVTETAQPGITTLKVNTTGKQTGTYMEAKYHRS
jgi:hypothetical protein